MEKSSPEKQIELTENHLEELSKLLGVSSNSTSWRKKIRIHQGWWRAFVLGVPQGEYHDKKNNVWKKVCNRVFEETSSGNINFLGEAASKAAKGETYIHEFRQIIETVKSKGLMKEKFQGTEKL